MTNKTPFKHSYEYWEYKVKLHIILHNIMFYLLLIFISLFHVLSLFIIIIIL